MAGRFTAEQLATIHIVAGAARRDGRDPLSSVLEAYQAHGLQPSRVKAEQPVQPQRPGMHPMMPHLIRIRHSASLMTGKRGGTRQRPQLMGAMGSLDAFRRMLSR